MTGRENAKIPTATPIIPHKMADLPSDGLLFRNWTPATINMITAKPTNKGQIKLLITLKNPLTTLKRVRLFAGVAWATNGKVSKTPKKITEDIFFIFNLSFIINQSAYL